MREIIDRIVYYQGLGSKHALTLSILVIFGMVIWACISPIRRSAANVLPPSIRGKITKIRGENQYKNEQNPPTEGGSTPEITGAIENKNTEKSDQNTINGIENEEND